MDRSEVKTASERVEDAMREVGILLIALAPLDVAMSERGIRGNLLALLLFFGLGALLFMVALLLERRR